MDRFKEIEGKQKSEGGERRMVTILKYIKKDNTKQLSLFDFIPPPNRFSIFSKEGNIILLPNLIMKSYKDGEINKDYAEYLCKVIIEYYPYEKLETIIAAIRLLPELSKNCFNYLEYILVSHNWYDLKICAFEILSKTFPKKSKKVIKFALEKLSILRYLLKRHRIFELEYICRENNIPVLHLYFHLYHFFIRNKFRYNDLEKRIFGPAGPLNQNLKIQDSNGPFRFHDPKESPLYTKKLSDLLLKIERKYIPTLKLFRYWRVEKWSMLKIWEKNKKEYFGIRYKYFKRIMRTLIRLYNLDEKRIICSFYKNKSAPYLYVNIPEIGLEIRFPAIKVLNR
ncbi:MAG: hypothetical protein ACP6IY_10690 [Promethearchaeia archaeon]